MILQYKCDIMKISPQWFGYSKLYAEHSDIRLNGWNWQPRLPGKPMVETDSPDYLENQRVWHFYCIKLLGIG